MASGRIVRLKREAGFGFIKVDGERDSDVFFHRSSLSNATFEDLSEGNCVTFDIGHSAKGPRAENVTVTSV